MDGLRNELTEKVQDLSVCSWGGVCYGGCGLAEWLRCVGVFKVDVGFVVECMIGGISLWGGGIFSTIMALDGVSVSFVVWVLYLELVLLATCTVGFG